MRLSRCFVCFIMCMKYLINNTECENTAITYNEVAYTVIIIRHNQPF
jgi:hypothetical protein